MLSLFPISLTVGQMNVLSVYVCFPQPNLRFIRHEVMFQNVDFNEIMRNLVHCQKHLRATFTKLSFVKTVPFRFKIAELSFKIISFLAKYYLRYICYKDKLLYQLVVKMYQIHLLFRPWPISCLII